MNDTPTTDRVKLTRTAIYQITKHLHEVCHTDADGFAVYHLHDTDASVAEEMTPHCGMTVNPGHVASLRREFFGGFRVVKGGAGKISTTEFGDLSNRVAAVEDEFVATRGAITHDDALKIHEAAASVMTALEAVQGQLADMVQRIEAIERTRIVDVSAA